MNPSRTLNDERAAVEIGSAVVETYEFVAAELLKDLLRTEEGIADKLNAESRFLGTWRLIELWVSAAAGAIATTASAIRLAFRNRGRQSTHSTSPSLLSDWSQSRTQS